ncbi:MAG: hypothetical protein PSY12_06395 [bacterium]|nr:hypothetical protein [bacterium]
MAQPDTSPIPSRGGDYFSTSRPLGDMERASHLSNLTGGYTVTDWRYSPIELSPTEKMEVILSRMFGVTTLVVVVAAILMAVL